MPQDTGFPVLEGRASETRPPGNCGRPCCGTQVSQGRPLFWGTTSVKREQQVDAPNERILAIIGTYSILCSKGGLHSVARTPRTFGSLCYGIQASLSGTRVTELTPPGPREAPVPRPAPRGVSGVRVTEHPFLRPRETTIQGHGPVSLT